MSFGVTAVFAGTKARSAPVAAQPLQNIFVWAMGNDPVNTAEVELDLLEELAKHQIAGERASKIFPQGMPASPDEARVEIAAVQLGP